MVEFVCLSPRKLNLQAYPRHDKREDEGIKEKRAEERHTPIFPPLVLAVQVHRTATTDYSTPCCRNNQQYPHHHHQLFVAPKLASLLSYHFE